MPDVEKGRNINSLEDVNSDFGLTSGSNISASQVSSDSWL
jgi:hypothetical protein